MVVFALSFSLYSQITQTGTLTGTVVDKEGDPLPGVDVTISSPALMTPQLSKVTNYRGFFRFAALPPGVYTVTYKLSGFKTFIREGVRISVGETITLINETLEISPIEETVMVTGEAPVMDMTKSTISTTYKKEFLENIPTTRRRIARYFELIPGESEGTFHGTTSGDQAYMLDGLNISDPLSGSILASYGFDLMEELSVDTGALRAEYGNVRGAVINAVTKSGGNEFHGQISFYYRNDSLQSDNSKGTPLEGRSIGYNFENDLSFGLGGPIIKDKLWFFTNNQYFWYAEYIQGYPYDAATNLSLFHPRLYMPYIKLSWQIKPDNKLTFSYTYKHFGYNDRGASRFNNEDTTAIQKNPDHTVNIMWAKSFGDNLFFDVKAGLCTHLLGSYAKHDTPRIYDSVTRLYSQNYRWDDVSRRPKAQLTANATYFVDEWIGQHEFKTGLDLVNGWYRTTDTFFEDPITGLRGTIRLRNGVPDHFRHEENYDRKNIIQTIGTYIQDSWRPTKRLALNIGIRYDYQQGIVPKQGEDRNPIVYEGVTYDPRVTKSFKPIVWNTLSPRLGLVYDLTGDGKTLLKASFGRYFQILQGQYFGRDLNPNSAITWRVRLNPDGTAKGGPYMFSSATISELDPNLKTPYLDELTVGIDREIIKDMKLSLRYIKKWDRNIMDKIDRNALDMDALRNGEWVWTNFTPYTTTDPFNGQRVTFYGVKDTSIPSSIYITNPPGAKRDYDALEVTITKRYSHRWQLFASYVYAHARGDRPLTRGLSSFFQDPNSLINAFGRQVRVRPHQFKLQCGVNGPWGINFSGYITWEAGRPYTREIRSNDLGLSLSQGNITIYAEEKGSNPYPAQFLLDLRLEKYFSLGKFGKLAFMLDGFNLLNSNTTTEWETISSRSSITFKETVDILDPRILRIGVKLEF